MGITGYKLDLTLGAERKARLAAAAKARGTSMAEVARDAIDLAVDGGGLAVAFVDDDGNEFGGADFTAGERRKMEAAARADGVSLGELILQAVDMRLDADGG